jgi:glycosyltransferase involved in cell wall biosynthesis
MRILKTSVLIPSLGRPKSLEKCLLSLDAQVIRPSEVIVAWQGHDTQTRDYALEAAEIVKFPLHVVHCKEQGIVPAENAALDRAGGEIIFLIDDDAVAQPDWLSKHLWHYKDASIGAVGGSADSFDRDGTPFRRRSYRHIGQLTWYGRLIGNMHDQPTEWRSRKPIEVDHLVGYNLSVRRKAFLRFENNLKPYWQMFEADLCYQVRERGYRVLFDFSNVVCHYPTNSIYTGGRGGNLTLKICNAAYNHAFVLAKHSPRRLRPWRLLYLLFVGTTNTPGLLALPFALRAYGGPRTEISVLRSSWLHHLLGWRSGSAKRNKTPVIR